MAMIMAACVPNAAAHELHAIGVHEDYTKQQNATVPLRVDRPGEGVTLLLGSYDPLMWDITTSQDTQIVRIILAGFKPQLSAIKINGEIFEKAVLRPDLNAPYKLAGPVFRTWVTHVPGELGFENLSSFQGEYYAKQGGYEITYVDTETEVLEADYLRHYVTTSGPHTKVQIEGTIGGRSGLFKSDGSLISAVDYPRTAHASFTAAGDAGFIYTGKVIRHISGVRHKVEGIIPKPPVWAGVGHFKTLALDEKRGRLIALYQAGGSDIDIMAYDLRREKWSRISYAGDGRYLPNSMLYVKEGDYFLISGTQFTGRAFVGRLSADETFEILRTFKGKDFPGLTDLYNVGNSGLPNIYIAGFDGQRIALATDGRDIFQRSKGIGRLLRVYVTDMDGGDIDLTFYEKPEMPKSKKRPFFQK